ncbi:MAG: mechanosensitive ion channel domain-containing protein [Pseudomonadota bacterium]
MNTFFDPQQYIQWLSEMRSWFLSQVLMPDRLKQIAVQIALLLATRLVGALIGRWAQGVLKQPLDNIAIRYPSLARMMRTLLRQTPLIVSIFLLWVSIGAVAKTGNGIFLMRLILNLSAAWVVIKLVASTVSNRFWSRLLGTVAWTLAALNILGLLDETLVLLESIGFSIGSVKLTVLSLIKAAVILMLLLRAVKWLSGIVDHKLSTATDFSPSTRLMLSKTINIGLMVVVTLVALNSVGIDLTALAVFSGAVGVGVGFGLQKIVGNLISGLILLSDKSIKPGDVVEVADVYGVVNHMGGRYVSVVTRDEKEYLIPNEDLITQQVVNWSYSSRRLRIKASVGISYKADPHRAIEVILGAVQGTPRVLKDPPPLCLLVGFGDSSVDLQVRYWIEDPENGVANVTSAVLLKIWDALKDSGIEIPFPQRDVHLNVAAPVRVTAAEEK